jgi:hypothetical protein
MLEHEDNTQQDSDNRTNSYFEVVEVEYKPQQVVVE